MPFIAHGRHHLDQKESGEWREKPFLRLLEESLEAAEAERVMRTATQWGRDDEVLEDDDHTGLIQLPQDAEVHEPETI